MLQWTRIQFGDWRDQPDVVKKLMHMICAQHKAIVSQDNLNRDFEACRQRYHATQALNQELMHSAHDPSLLLEAVVMLLTGEVRIILSSLNVPLCSPNKN